MIAKQIDMRRAEKSSARRLVEYLTNEQGKAHRVAEAFTRNCFSDSPDLAALEMLSTQAGNQRSRCDKTCHLLISFRPGEEVSGSVVREIENAVCERLGFGEHQRISVLHRDTDSLHLHIAVNKIHPVRFTSHDPFQSHTALAKLCGELEQKYRLEADNHIPTGKTKGERQAADTEATTGQESLLSWTRRECLPALRAADTWRELHETLAKAGLTLALRGNGVVIADASGARIKASDVDRALSRGNLEKRLGPFQPREGTAKSTQLEKTYQKAPLTGAKALKEEFERIRTAVIAVRTAKLTAIRQRLKQHVGHLNAENKAAYLEAKRSRAGRSAKRELFLALRTKHRAATRSARQEAAQTRQQIKTESPRHTWLSWLQEQALAGRADALQTLRSRAFSLARKVTTIGGENRLITDAAATLLTNQPVNGVTKRGVVIYRVGDETLRDDGHAFRLSREAGLDTTIMALKLAKRRYGDQLQIEGDRQFRERMVQATVAGNLVIRFADPDLESRRRDLAFAKAYPNRQLNKRERGR